MTLSIKHNENRLIYIIRVAQVVKNEGLNFNDIKKVCFNQIDMTSSPDLEPTIYKYEESLFNRVYSGIVNPVFLPLDLFEFNYFNLISGVGMGFGLPSDFAEGSTRSKSALAYKKNVAFFSGAKTFQQTLDLSNSVFNPDGTKRAFKEFKEIATSINTQYNVNWLKTEQNAAFRVAQSAEAWHQIEDEKEIFPLLKYVTVGDERVRNTHAALDGIIKPVGHEFWDTNFPLNDWGCRCVVIQLDEGKETNLTKHLKEYNQSVPTKKQVKTLRNNSTVFANNAGKSGVIFPKTGHPYSSVPNEYKEAQKINFGFDTPTDKEVKKHITKIKK